MELSACRRLLLYDESIGGKIRVKTQSSPTSGLVCFLLLLSLPAYLLFLLGQCFYYYYVASRSICHANLVGRNFSHDLGGLGAVL